MHDDAIPETAARWLPFVQAFILAYGQGEYLSGRQNCSPAAAESLVAPPRAARPHEEPLSVLLCSPHPDDEILTGALPLRLLREQGARVVNLAVTLGSNVARQGERWTELLAACAEIGFVCERFNPPPGFSVKSGAAGQGWPAAVEGLAELLAQMAPDVVFFPHAQDAHPAHRATHQLVTAALTQLTARHPVEVKAVETEYWSSMAEANLLIGISPADVARLLAGLHCHRGEVARNPYHLTFPARLMDTVRRGAEQVPSRALSRPGFLFGELYRLTVWRQGKSHQVAVRNGWFGPSQGLEGLLDSAIIGR